MQHMHKCIVITCDT